MNALFGEENQFGTPATGKIRAAAEAAIANKLLPISTPERGTAEVIQAPCMPETEIMVTPRALSADSPSNPFPGVPVIVSVPMPAAVGEATANAADAEGGEESNHDDSSEPGDVEPFSPIEPDPLPVPSMSRATFPDLPSAAVPGTETPRNGIEAPILLRPGSSAAAEAEPVCLTAVPGTAVPSTDRVSIPISEIAAQASRAMESQGEAARSQVSEADAAFGQGSQRVVPMLGELGGQAGAVRRRVSNSGGDGTGDIPREPAPDSGFRFTGGLLGLMLFGLIAGGWTWIQISGPEEELPAEEIRVLATPAESARPALFAAQLTESDLFAADAEWVKSATFTPISSGLSGDVAAAFGLADLADAEAGRAR